MDTTTMQTRERLPFAAGQCRGFRLHKLEVLNWGTFDGQVYTIRPNGKTALLIGQNGSGKSTLVDAILTLLVRPGVRNFNVAAGAKKRERDERTYVRGAYDRGADDDGRGIEVKFLRPKGGQYSVILAFFHNEDTGKSFTVAQVLWLASDLSVEKVYCLSEDERSIQEDFGKLESTDGMLKAIRSKAFRATRTYQEFETWFIKLTRVKAKAMEVFNQTVAVKDIHRLNDFIRDHMLEGEIGTRKLSASLVTSRTSAKHTRVWFACANSLNSWHRLPGSGQNSGSKRRLWNVLSAFWPQRMPISRRRSLISLRQSWSDVSKNCRKSVPQRRHSLRRHALQASRPAACSMRSRRSAATVYAKSPS